jgi:hypothetical protein
MVNMNSLAGNRVNSGQLGNRASFRGCRADNAFACNTNVPSGRRARTKLWGTLQNLQVHADNSITYHGKSRHHVTINEYSSGCSL